MPGKSVHNERTVATYCYQCVAGPDLLKVRVEDGVATEVTPNFDAAVVHPAGGKVCVATIINGGITAFDPDGSVEHYPFPDILVTNICFGGPDMMDAWVTCSSTGKLYKARWPRPGLKLNFNA